MGLLPSVRIILGMLLLGVVARADMTVGQYREGLADKKNAVMLAGAKAIVRATADGISWANTEATRRGTPLYCQPPKLVLDAPEFLEMLDSQISAAAQRFTESQLLSLPIGSLLMYAMMTRFPCEK
jgi:hypothetical protein